MAGVIVWVALAAEAEPLKVTLVQVTVLPPTVNYMRWTGCRLWSRGNLPIEVA
jgi:hypothetical protein